MTSNDLLVLLLVLTLSVGVFGGHFGYVVNGVPVEAGSTSGLDWGFLFALLTFSVDGVPAIFETVFLVIQILTGWMIVKLVRGVSG